MIKGYRHLDSKSVKKIMFHEKLKTFMKKTFKWWMIIAGILLLFVIWLISFYLTLDKLETPGKKKITGQSANFKKISNHIFTVRNFFLVFYTPNDILKS